MQLIGFALAALVGLSLGLLGGGGSILTVPIFVYVLGFDAKTAIAMSLPVVGATALVGAARHWRAGNVSTRLALVFGGVAMGGAYLGARLAVFVSGRVQLTLLAATMLAAATSMFLSARKRDAAGSGRSTPAASPSFALVLAIGAGVGLMTGVMGIGGGFLIVPALVVLAGLPMTHAIGTSLVVIALNAFAGLAGYLGRVTLPWGVVASFTAVAITGILVGTHLVRFISHAALKRAFAGFLVLLGVLILIQNNR